MQRVAQDWFVLAVSHSPTAVGVTIAMQFAPTLLFGLYGGVLADRYPRRSLLIATQTTAGLLSATLAVLALSGRLTVLGVDLLAFALGLVVAVDNPARQSFVGELVGGPLIRNAVSLNSTIFQLGGLVGPALSGLLIGAVGRRLVLRRQRRDLPAGAGRAGRSSTAPGCGPSSRVDARRRASCARGCTTSTSGPSCSG